MTALPPSIQRGRKPPPACQSHTADLLCRGRPLLAVGADRGVKYRCSITGLAALRHASCGGGYLDRFSCEILASQHYSVRAMTELTRTPPGKVVQCGLFSGSGPCSV